MKNIMIIHGEGNLNVNPNLAGIVEILWEQGYRIHYYCQRKPGTPQTAPHDGVKYVFIDNAQLRLVGNYALVIGVDRDGIILAAKVANQLHIPCGYISYEIFFGNETGPDFKQPEIDACSNIRFAVCQGNERSRHLAHENRIAPDKIIDIPVAGRAMRRVERNTRLHTAFGLPHETKIALYIGSLISAWAMVDELILSTRDWDNDWALVLHDRYHNPTLQQRLRQNHPQATRVHITQQSGLTFDALETLVQSADLGIALYRPTYANIYEGNNLKYLGLSSGKIATYLQYGVPIAVNDIGEMANHVDEHELGIHVRDLNELPECLRAADRDTLGRWRENCYRYFERNLDLQNRMIPLLDAVKACTD